MYPINMSFIFSRNNNKLINKIHGQTSITCALNISEKVLRLMISAKLDLLLIQ